MSKSAYVFERKGRSGFYVQIRAAGERKTLRAGDTREQAENFARTAATLRDNGHDIEGILAALMPGRKGAPPPASERLVFTDAVPRYLASAKNRLRASSYKTQEVKLRRIVREPWAKKRLDTITPVMLNVWLERRRASDIAPDTINGDISSISCVYRWAASVGISTTHDPTRSALVQRGRTQRRDLWYSADEAQTLFAAADQHVPDITTVLKILFWTGMRCGELSRIEWRDVDTKAGTVKIRGEVSKNGKPRLFNLTPDALALIGSLPSRFKGGRVLVRPGGNPFTKYIYYDLVTKLRPHLGALPEHKRHFRLHALRHSHITLLAAQGVSLALIGQSVGQSSTYMTSRYTHVTPQGLRTVSDAGATAFQPTTTNTTKAAK